MTAKNFRAQSPSPEPSSQYVNIIEAIPPEDTQPLAQVLNQPVPTTQLGVYTATSVPPLPPTPQMSSSSSASSHANAVAYPDISQTSKILRRTPPPVPGRSLDAAKTSPAILLVGLTGSGKSTLISLLTKAAVTIGHDLSSCTSEIATYTANIEGTVVRLIDTPGFDDTNRSDTDILGAIALTLAMLYRERVPLLGVLYLHRISDTRVGGASRKCLRILENLAGQSAFGCFLIATTMWDKVSPAEGDRREKELVLNPQFFGTLYNKGSGAMIMRHSGTRESAKEIVKQAMTRWGGQGVVLQIQRQLVDEGLPLEATTAGRFVDAALREQQAKQQEEIKELEAALQECRDDSTLALLKEEHQAQLARVQELNTSRQGLRGTYRQLADRLIPRAESPSNIDWDSGYSKEGSIAASEIIALREELQMMKDQMRLWQDSQAEQEYTLLTMKAEQRMQKYNTEEERRNLLKAFEEKSAELAKRERMEKYRDRERRKLESQRYAHGSSSGSSSVSHHHGHGGRSTGTGDRFWRWISGPGYGSVSMFG